MHKGFFPQFKLCLLSLKYAKFSNAVAIFRLSLVDIFLIVIDIHEIFYTSYPFFCTMSHFWEIWNSDLCIRHKILPSCKVGRNEICLTFVVDLYTRFYSRSGSDLENQTHRQTSPHCAFILCTEFTDCTKINMAMNLLCCRTRNVKIFQSWK
jgi:hypothetical protein